MSEVDQLRALILVVAAGVLAFGAVLAGGPVLLPAIAWLLGIVLTPLSRVPGRIALRSALRAPQRASAMAATLVLASLLLAVVFVGLQSMTTSVQSRIAARFPAAVLTQSAADQQLPGDLEGRINDLPESGTVAAIQSATMAGSDGKQITFSAIDPKSFPPLLAGATDAGSLSDLAPGTVALDRAQAAAWQVRVGPPLTSAAPEARSSWGWARSTAPAACCNRSRCTRRTCPGSRRTRPVSGRSWPIPPPECPSTRCAARSRRSWVRTRTCRCSPPPTSGPSSNGRSN